MRKRLLALTAAIAVLPALLCGCSSRQKPRIGLVLTAKTGYFWESVLQGAQMAAEEMGCELIYDAPNNEGDYAVQLLIAQHMIDEGLDVLVMSPSDVYAAGAFIDQCQKQVVLINSPAETSRSVVTFMGAAEKTGELLGLQILDRAPAREPAVAIIQSKPFVGVSQEQSDALSAAIEEAGGSIVARRYCQGSEETAYQQALELLEDYPDLTAIAAMSAPAAEGASRAIVERKSGAFVAALEASMGEVGYLEQGVIKALIVQNAYAMGYRGVEYAANLAQGHVYPVQNVIEPNLVTLENLYTPHIEKLIFPFS